MDVILASASFRRQDILRQIGFDTYVVHPTGIDETPHKDESGRPYALRMAQEKAYVVHMADDTCVLSADTVVCTSRRILPKVEDIDTAKECITYLAGRRHTVYTAMCLRTPSHTHIKVIKTMVQLKNLDQGEIQDYIHHGDWHGKAGGYAIQGYASRYISQISGSYSAVVGLDAHTVYKWLRQYGLIQ